MAVASSLSVASFFKYHIFHPAELTQQIDYVIALTASIALGIFTFGLFHIFCFAALYDDRTYKVIKSPEGTEKKTSAAFEDTIGKTIKDEKIPPSKDSVVIPAVPPSIHVIEENKEGKLEKPSIDSSEPVQRSPRKKKRIHHVKHADAKTEAPSADLPPKTDFLKPKRNLGTPNIPELALPSKEPIEKAAEKKEIQLKKQHHKQKVKEGTTPNSTPRTPKDASTLSVSFKLPEKVPADVEDSESMSEGITPRDLDEVTKSASDPKIAAKMLHKSKKPEPEFVKFGEKSVIRLTKAKELAAKGDLTYQMLLGKLYLFGYSEMPKSRSQAFYWYNKAATDHKDPKALYRAGKMHFRGYGTPKSPGNGRILIEQASLLGSEKATKYLNKHPPKDAK